jgi:dTDP-4-dehydrorhamnose 3,5-epimerase-like enzyme
MIADMSAETGIEGLLVLPERSGRDGRGVVREFYRRSELAEAAGLDVRWQQINITTTERGAVRGLHGEPMAKLVGLAAGQALIAIDPSNRSQISAKDAELPTFAEVYGVAPARPSPRRN